MELVLTVAVASVLLGAALAFGASRRSPWLAALHTLAVAAVLATVVVQLLPEAIGEVGGSALLVFLGALVLPVAVGQLVGWVRRASAGEADSTEQVIHLELGYFGLLLHQIIEGLVLGTLAESPHAKELMIAIAAHTLPLTTLVVKTYFSERGAKSAALRTLGLVVATVAGIVSGGAAVADLAASMTPWVSAVLSGLLCHVILHDHGSTPLRKHRSRVLEGIAAASGLALPFVAAAFESHGAGIATVRDQLGHSFFELVVETAPMLLLGLVIAAALQMYGSRLPSSWLRSGGISSQAARGVLVGAPLPICACGVLPVAESLRKRGAGPALVVAFLLATPELGPETLTLTVRFLGWPFAIVRLGAALVVAFVAAWLMARSLARDQQSEDASPEALAEVLTSEPSGPAYRRFLGFFDELLHHVGPWTLVGLIVAAYIEVTLPADSLSGLASTGLDIVVVSVVAIPAYVCASSATPLAAVLIAKGISPGAVLAGLLLGPATNVATFGTLRRAYGGRATVVMVVGLVMATWVIGYAINGVALPVTVEGFGAEVHEHGPLALAATAILGLFVAGQLWRSGLLSWIASLTGARAGHDHDHDHERAQATT